MKALTLWQPWASLVALGEKKIETRSWATPYRGALAIHAAKNFPDDARLLCLLEPFKAALINNNLVTVRGYPPSETLDTTELPLGAIVAVCELVDCKSTNSMYEGEKFFGWWNGNDEWRLTAKEYKFGDYSRNRFAWLLKNIRKLETPVPCRGYQQLWDVPADALAQIEAQIMNEQPSPNDGFMLSYKPNPIKKCPRCVTGQLVVKTNHDTDEKFLGCTEFPNCKHTKPLPIDILLRAQGAPTLPGLE